MPVQILDHTAGHRLALGIQTAPRRRATLGGSWQVQLSPAGRRNPTRHAALRR